MNTSRRMIHTVGGLVLVGLGVAGMIVPIVPGIPLAIAGVVLLRSNHSVVGSVMEHLKRWRDSRQRPGGRTGTPTGSPRDGSE